MIFLQIILWALASTSQWPSRTVSNAAPQIVKATATSSWPGCWLEPSRRAALRYAIRPWRIQTTYRTCMTLLLIISLLQTLLSYSTMFRLTQSIWSLTGPHSVLQAAEILKMWFYWNFLVFFQQIQFIFQIKLSNNVVLFWKWLDAFSNQRRWCFGRGKDEWKQRVPVELL